MADSEDHDDDSHGGDSDDEIAELRIQALLTKKVNEAEVSPSRESAPHGSYKNINRSHHGERNRSFRHPQGDNRSEHAIGRIPVVGAPNYIVDLTPSHNQGGYGSNYNSTADSGKNFRRTGNYNPRGRFRGRGQDRYGGSRGYERNYNNSYSGPPPSKTESPTLVLPQDKYANKPLPEQNKVKEKMSARWRRIQGSDSESDSEDTESDSSDTSSDSSESSSSSSGSTSGSDSESDESSIHKRKVVKDGKKEVSTVEDATKSSTGPSTGNSILQRQHSNKSALSKSPPKQVVGHGKITSQKSMGSLRRNSVSPSTKKYISSQQQKTSPKQLPRRLSSSPPSRRPWASNARPHSPGRHQGSRSPVPTAGGRSPVPRSRTVRSRSITPQRKISRSSRSPIPWARERSPVPRGRSRSPFPRRNSPRRGSRSPLPKRNLSPLPRRDPRSSPFRRDAKGSRPRIASLGRRSSRSPLGRGSRSPLRRILRSPLGRSSRSPLGRNKRLIGRSSRSPGGLNSRSVGRRGSRSPFGRRGSRSPLRRRGSLSPLSRRSPRNPVHRRGSRSPPPLKGSRSPLPRSSRSPPKKRGSGSFLPRRNSRSPVSKRNSRSPLARRTSRSPLLTPRSRRSPLPRRNSNSVQRNNSRSPLRRGSRSPILRRSSRSPLRRQSSRSPIRRQGSRSPFHRRGSRSPLPRQKSRSPKQGRNSTKSSVPPKGSRSPISRLHSRNSLPRHPSRSPYRERAQSPPGDRSRIPLEKGRGRSRSPLPPRRTSRSPLLRKGSRSPLRRVSRSPIGGRIGRSPYKLNKNSPQKIPIISPSNRNARSSPLQHISKSPLQRRLSRSPLRTRSPISRRLSKSPLPPSSRSPVSRMLSKSPQHLTRSPALRRISRSPLPRQLSRTPPPPLRRIRNVSLHRGDKSPSRRLHRTSPASHRSYSPNRRIQRFSGSPISPRNFNSRNQGFRRSQSPGLRRGPGVAGRSHTSIGRSPSPSGRRDWVGGRRSRSPGAFRAGSPFARNSRSLSPQNRVGRPNSPLRGRNQRLLNRGSRGGFNRQGFGPNENAHANRFPQGNALAAAGRLEFPPGFNNFNINNNQPFHEYNEADSGPSGRPGWSQAGRRDDREQFSPQRLLEATWQGQYQQRDRPGSLLYPHLDQYNNRGQLHNMPIHSLQGSRIQSSRGRGRGRQNSPKPLVFRSATPPALLDMSPQRFHASGRFADMPPQGQNERRRQFSPNRLPARNSERSRSNSPYTAGSQVHLQGGRGRALSPREQVRRGPRTPPIPSNRKLSPRQSLWPEGKGNVHSSRGSPSFVHDRIPTASGSSQNTERYPSRTDSPTDHREPFRTRDPVSHQQQYRSGRSHSPSHDQRQDDLRDRLGRDPGTHAPHDRKKRGASSPQKTETRNRVNSTSSRGRGRGNRGRRPLSPSDRNRRPLGQGADGSVQPHPRSPANHPKGTASANWERRENKTSSQQGKTNPKFTHHSPERQGRNGSPWLEPVTPEKQAQAGGEHALTPPINVGEAQKNKASKQETKPSVKSKENERRPRTENKHKEEVPSKGKRDASKRSESNIQESHHKKAEDTSQVSSQDSKKILLKPKEEQRPLENKVAKEKEEKEDLDDKKRKKKKKKYRKLEDGEEDSDDDVSVKSKSSKKKKKEKKKKKDSKKKKKKHKKADSESEEVEQPRNKSQKDGKKDPSDLPDLRHSLKRKLDSTGEKGSVKSSTKEQEEKSRRKDRDEDSKDSKSRQNDDTTRKKRHDGKPILVTVRSGEDRKVTSGKPSEKRVGSSSSSQRVSVHDRLGPAKSSWEDSKSSRGSGSGSSSRQKRGDKSKSHQSGGGGTNSSSSSRLKLRR